MLQACTKAPGSVVNVQCIAAFNCDILQQRFAAVRKPRLNAFFKFQCQQLCSLQIAPSLTISIAHIGYLGL